MDIASITKEYASSKLTEELQFFFKENIPKNIHLKEVLGSAISGIISGSYTKDSLSYVFVCENKESAAYFYNDFQYLLPDTAVLFYPSSYQRPYQITEGTDNANVVLRAEVLHKLKIAQSSKNDSYVVVTYPEAIFEKVVSSEQLQDKTLEVKVGDQLSIDFLNEVLFEYEFKRVDFVTQAGEFSVRGGIIDIFSFSNEQPYRIEFFGDEIDSIRTFDIVSQLSDQKVTHITIVPDIESKTFMKDRVPFVAGLPKDSVLIFQDLERTYHKLDELYIKASNTFESLENTIVRQSPEQLFCDANSTRSLFSNFTQIQVGSIFHDDPLLQNSQKPQIISHKILPQPSFHKNFDLLLENLQSFQDKGYTIEIYCANTTQTQRLKDIFENIKAEVAYKFLVGSLHEGFIDPILKKVCYTDHQIFERYHRFSIKNTKSQKQALTLKELTTLQVGDYITHIDHGIGKFAGLQKIEVEGRTQETIKLIYGERDILYVSIHALHKISKFNGKDGKVPKVHKLGSKTWKTLKQKTKTRVKHIAYNLIKLYAKRKLEKGFSYGPDTYLQHELEASFLYEDTPDQSAATKSVKLDMESPNPMDRLVCGDVGFGKTEVAIRAAFKAVDNGKQVAVLVPTTILAFQHYKTFSSRLKDFPVTIEYLNRFRTLKEKKDILQRLQEGKVDILIGTHQVAGKSVKYYDLGLLIIDEEQKFGVSVKDKLKTIKANVDTLTLTATPIPRTLQFSLMAARDLSTIATPPPNRYPIETQLVRFNEEVLRDAIAYEIHRGGQVFFIHNRIQNIKEVAGLLQRLVPDSRIAVAHGQMDGKSLEKLMLQFMDGDFDILVSTTIIESGLDVPNANTIFINNANNFGLSDLHQMRGRVGRSNKKAFCYFITPPSSAMTDDARKRLSALVQFSDLGSGIQIAMKDLEIRGAGDLLGAEQTGFINEIGFGTYQKILNEAVEELQEKEFQNLYENNSSDQKDKVYVKDTQIDTDFSLLLPDDYINSVKERFYLYSQLNTIKSEEKLQEFEHILKDRFGVLPEEATDLLNSVRVKWLASSIGLEKIVLKKEKFVGYFISDQQSDFYQGEQFRGILDFVMKHPKDFIIKEKDTRNGLRLLLVFEGATTIDVVLSKLQLFVTKPC